MTNIICPRAWYFAEICLCSSQNLTEIANTTVFILRKKVISLLVYGKAHRISSRTRQFGFLLILLLTLAS
jgi:hypothetical protein